MAIAKSHKMTLTEPISLPKCAQRCNIKQNFPPPKIASLVCFHFPSKSLEPSTLSKCLSLLFAFYEFPVFLLHHPHQQPLHDLQSQGWIEDTLANAIFPGKKSAIIYNHIFPRIYGVGVRMYCELPRNLGRSWKKSSQISQDFFSIVCLSLLLYIHASLSLWRLPRWKGSRSFLLEMIHLVDLPA